MHTKSVSSYLLLLLVHAQATSNGVISIALGCTVDYALLGCKTAWNDTTDPSFNGSTPMIRGSCLDSVKPYMEWTGAPKSTTAYSIRTGDGIKSEDMTAYSPDEYMNIYVRVLEPFSQYRGLLLYAVNASQNCSSANTYCKVGDWVVPDERITYFSTTSNCKKSVIHSTSAIKQYLTIFTFRAPPAGTGTITFKILFKTGNPNPTSSGDFLFPASELILTERPKANNIPSNWVVLPVGSDCATYCQGLGKTCMPSTLENLALVDLARIYPCHPATFYACSDGPEATTVDDICSTHLPSSYCPKGYTAPSCAVQSTNLTAQFCACGDYTTFSYRDKITPTAPPTLGIIPPSPSSPAVTTPSSPSVAAPSAFTMEASTGSRSSVSIGLSLVLMSTPSSLLRTLAVLVAFMKTIEAHNFLEGIRGRSPFASTIAPTFPQMDRETVHVQVAQDQEFTVEWANAHGGFTYWVVLHAKDENMLRKHTAANLDAYLKNCPTNASLNALGRGAKFHVAPPHFNISYDKYIVTSTPPNLLFDSVSQPGDDDYLNRDMALDTGFSSISNRCDAYGAQYNKTSPADCLNKTLQIRYLASKGIDMGDKRCKYTNPNFTWIEEVAKFYHPTFTPLAATAAFNISGLSGPGRYQLHWLWAAFRDTMDIDVRPRNETVVRRYGTRGNASADARKYGTADHCIFENAQAFTGACIAVPPFDPIGQQCRTKCDLTSTCKGYALVPLSSANDNRILFHEESPIPWNGSVYQKQDGTLGIRSNPYCLRDQFEGLPPETLVCYLITQYRDDNAGSLLPWIVNYDTFSSTFYSTCFVKARLWNFEYNVSKAPDIEPAPFRFGRACIPCEDYNASSTSVVDRVWRTVDQCVDCSRFPSATLRAIAKPPVLAQITATVATALNSNATFISFNGAVSCNGKPCYKWLSPAGSPHATSSECAFFAKKDAECLSVGNPITVMFAGGRTSSTTLVITGIPGSQFGNWNQSSLGNVKFRNCACWLKSSYDTFPDGPQYSLSNTTGWLNATGIITSNSGWNNFKIYTVA